VTAGDAARLRVPVGADADRWSTRGGLRTVLLVVHNVTSATRLLDVLPLFRDDLRIQLRVTCTGSSPFQAGISELFGRLALPVLPWAQALETPVDLALSASLGGQIQEIQGKLAVLSHGVGYNKRLATGSREPGAGSREPVFGLSEPWLVVDGELVPDALVLSHPEQFERLALACARALPVAVLGGDPCFDRILAARPHRERFRRALGVRDGQRLLVLNSTWNPQSLFGTTGTDVLPLLLERIVTELPVDEFRVAAVLHPNIWHGHGAGQVRTWLDRAVRAGVTLVDPLDGWRQALVAADTVLGDFGSVTYLAAAQGTPTMLAARDLSVLDPDSPVGRFVQEAPVLDPFTPLRPQLERLLRDHEPLPGPAELTTSVPGQAGRLLRRIFYGLAGLPEPEGPALLDPLPLPDYEPAQVTAPLRVLTRRAAAADVEVCRYSDSGPLPPGAEGAVHTAVSEDTLDPRRLELADLIHRAGAADDPRFGSPQRWAAEVLARYRQCGMAVYSTGADSCVVVTAAGACLRLSTRYGAVDPVAAASGLFACLAAGDTLPGLYRTGLTVRTGGTRHTVMVTPVVDAPVTPAEDGRLPAGR
jgi:hypothetical protein